MDALRVDAGFATAEEFVAAYDDEISEGGLILDGFEPGSIAQGERCVLVVAVAGEQAEAEALIGSVTGGTVSFLFAEVPEPFALLAERLRGAVTMAGDAPPAEPAAEEPPPEEPAPEEPPPEEPAEESAQPSPRGTVADRLAALTAAQKMQLALSGGREERMALMRDPNRILHNYVLRNPRIGLDEVQAAAKLPSMNPESLAFIADHPEWGRNSTVCIALARNPKTPTAIAVRMLDKIPEADVRLIAKGAGRAALVQAARRKLNL